MSRLFTVTVFLSAALLFTVEPLVGKLLLPLAGGTPAVWNTCMVFFQAALLAGYAYAHAAPNYLGTRRHAWLHLLVVAAPLCVMPIVVDRSVGVASEFPVPALLLVLVKSVGLPFFVLSTTAPLLQRWFTAVKPGGDPYPLYAASNAGSLLALLCYPFLLEPTWSLGQQSLGWTVGYGVYFALMAGCVAAVGRGERESAPLRVAAKQIQEPWLRWVALSFAPSSLLLGVTNYLSTDITPTPLLWVVPLALYLLTFILAFGARRWFPHSVACQLLPLAAIALFFAIMINATEPWWAIIAIHLGSFFLAALACHGELARLKPPPERLTRFYLWMSLGGLLGGVFNGLVAPWLFRKIGLAEYPIALALACALMPNRPRSKALEHIPEPRGVATLAYPLIIGAVAAGAFLVGRVAGWNDRLLAGVLFGVPLVFIYPLVDRPVRFAVGLLVVWAAAFLHVGEGGARMYFERNFFGQIKVTRESNGDAHRLVHGSTIHGRQFWKDGRGVNEPLTYYGRPGPIGDVFTERKITSVAACGLGAGSLAAYAKPDQYWTFFEIDPAMIRVASDPELFTFLSDNFPDRSRLQFALGDARLEIAKADDRKFDVIVLDAFSSDAIPIHLLTREAIEMYRAKLAPGGIIAFHISNRYLDLEPVLASAAADLKMFARLRQESLNAEEELSSGRISSHWVAMVAEERDFGRLASDSRWRKLAAPPTKFRTWTDDYSNILSVFKW